LDGSAATGAAAATATAAHPIVARISRSFIFPSLEIATDATALATL
jgi:hypothetical protein